jgi:two-component sensor histidine kinase
MGMLRLLWIILLLQTSLLALEIDKKTTFHELLSHSKLYEDQNQSETIISIQSKKFKPNDQKHIGYGYSPNVDVWIRFTLKNKTNYKLHQVIEYAHPLTTSILFFEEGLLKKEDGLLNRSKNRISLNPICEITLEPNESKQYYLKVSSQVTPLNIELKLWDAETFHKQERDNQIILALFFGAMLIMMFYHLAIFGNTGERSYIYYVLFILSIGFHHFIYSGAINLYSSSEFMDYLIHFFSVIVAITITLLALFTQKILQLEQYPRLNRSLISLLLFYPIVILVIGITNMYQYRSLYFVIILLFLFFITIYTQFKRSRKINYIIISLTLFTLSGILMYLSSSGKFNMFEDYPYVEFSLVIQVITFSFALTSELNALKAEKLVMETKEMLHREDEHRFKNTMSVLLSFIRYEKDKVDDNKTKDLLTRLRERCRNTMELHLLLKSEAKDTKQLISAILNNIKKSYEQENIRIDIQCNVNLPKKYVTPCGRIINEAVTNAFKYAFNETNNGKIEIHLQKKEENYYLIFKIMVVVLKRNIQWVQVQNL